MARPPECLALSWATIPNAAVYLALVLFLSLSHLLLSYDLRPKKCKELVCDDVCEERRVVKESDECGCAVHECVPRTDCPRRCGKCEECRRVCRERQIKISGYNLICISQNQ